MSGGKAEDIELQQAQCAGNNVQNGEGLRSLRGYSTMVFLKKGKHKRKKSRSSLRDLSKDENEKIPLAMGAVSKKGEVLGLEEVSNEFTCSSSFSETYQWNTNKESRYSFRKLDDGTFAIERKSSDELNPEKCDVGNTKKSKKICPQKGRRAYKPLKICFKKRSRSLRMKSDSNDDDKSESKTYSAPREKESGCSQHNESMSKSWINFKKMVTRRKKMHSSLKMQSDQTCQHLETTTNVNCSQCASNKKGFSKIKIPCMTFSRRKKSLESIVPAEETSEMQSAEPQPGSDCERSDKVLAIKYKLQRSLDAENREIGSVQHMFNSKSESQQLTQQKKSIGEPMILKEQNISNGVYVSHSEEEKMVLLSDQLKEELEVNSNCKELAGFAVQENVTLNSMIKYCGDDNQEQDPISSVLHAHTSHDDNHTEQIIENKNMENPDAASHSHLFYSEDGLNGGSLINDVTNYSIAIPDPYEIMLMTTAASLVKNVIQSSIQQLVDEGTFLNHVPGNILSRSTF